MRPSKTSTGHNNTSAALLNSVKKYRDTSQTYNEPSRTFTTKRTTHSNDYNWRKHMNSKINNNNNRNFARTSSTTTIHRSLHNNKNNHRS
jgi:hypothetical protein